MHLIVDQGNTNTKWALFHNGALEKIHVSTNEMSVDALNKFISESPQIKSSIVSSVDTLEEQLVKMIQEQGIYVLSYNQTTQLPIQNDYETKDTLGKDRLAMAVGAFLKHPNQPSLIISFGTCITYNVVHKKTFLGGAISPGLGMRLKSLHAFTDKLPLVKNVKIVNLIGRSTQDSILSGVINGIVAEVDRYIEKCKSEFTDLKVLITGGDAFFFAEHIKNPTFATQKIALEGLAHILEYNLH